MDLYICINVYVNVKDIVSLFLQLRLIFNVKKYYNLKDLLLNSAFVSYKYN